MSRKSVLITGLFVLAIGLCAGAMAGEEFKGDAYALSTCPISGEQLGEMGAPISLIHEGREVKFCCEGCLPKFKADPAKYMAKIDAKMIEEQLPYYPNNVCAVRGGPLGEMGDPIDLIVNNRLVRLCCAGCEKPLRAEPAKFIAPLDAAVLAKQKESYPFDKCLVSGESLGHGTHGKSVDLVVANRLVRLCCEACATQVQVNPAAYFAVIDSGEFKVVEQAEGSDHK